MNFAELCEARGFGTQLALSEATGYRVKQTTIGQLQRRWDADPRWSTVECLADALGVSAEVLMRAIRRGRKAS